MADTTSGRGQQKTAAPLAARSRLCGAAHVTRVPSQLVQRASLLGDVTQLLVMHPACGAHDASGALRGSAARAASAAGSAGEQGAAGGAAAAAPRGDTQNPAAAERRGTAPPASRALEAAPAAPEALVGRRVLREFEEGRFEGSVASARDSAGYGTLWRVTYDDGDDEELNWHELCTTLLPDTRAAAGGDAACTASGSASRQLRTSTTAVAAPVAPAAREYKGVSRESPTHRWNCVLYVPLSQRDAEAPKHGLVHLGRFDDVLEAARAYDAAARRHGILAVNFPRPGTREVQAVRGHGQKPALFFQGQQQQTTAQQRTAQQYLGVTLRRGGSFEARLRDFYGGMHRTAEAAAHAVDEELRRRNQLHKLNFPATAAERAAKARGRPAEAQATPAARVLKRAHEPESAAPTRAAKKPRTQPAAAGAAAAARGGPGLASAVAPAASDHDMKAAATEEPEEEFAAEDRAAAVPLPVAPAAVKQPASALPMAAPTAAPVLAPPAAAPAPPAAMNDNLAAVAAFLRGIHPPLVQLDAALAALPGSGMSMAHLACFGVSERESLLNDAADVLRIRAPLDRMVFKAALLALPRGAEQA